MKSKGFFIILFALLLPVLAFSQGRKTVEKKGIVKQTVYEYFLAEGMRDPLVEEIITYDKQGNEIEHKVLNKEGGVKSWLTFMYDEDGNKTGETILDDNGEQMERFEWIYEDDLVVEKRYFDYKDRLVKRKEYKFEYREE
ncbi:MAG: hypothetical protein K9G38_05800 [Bacteroidales bacterium]|nr:hypothetical protein [Bacteroidales bacterium]